MLQSHEHPLDPNEKVIGRPLVPGETFQSGDVYDSRTTRKWKQVPYYLIGKVVPEKHREVYIRPDNHYIAEHLGTSGLATFETH